MIADRLKKIEPVWCRDAADVENGYRFRLISIVTGIWSALGFYLEKGDINPGNEMRFETQIRQVHAKINGVAPA